MNLNMVFRGQDRYQLDPGFKVVHLKTSAEMQADSLYFDIDFDGIATEVTGNTYDATCIVKTQPLAQGNPRLANGTSGNAPNTFQMSFKTFTKPHDQHPHLLRFDGNAASEAVVMDEVQDSMKPSPNPTARCTVVQRKVIEASLSFKRILRAEQAAPNTTELPLPIPVAVHEDLCTTLITINENKQPEAERELLDVAISNVKDSKQEAMTPGDTMTANHKQADPLMPCIESPAVFDSIENTGKLPPADNESEISENDDAGSENGFKEFENHIEASDSHTEAYDSHTEAYDSHTEAYDSHTEASENNSQEYISDSELYINHVEASDIRTEVSGSNTEVSGINTDASDAKSAWSSNDEGQIGSDSKSSSSTANSAQTDDHKELTNTMDINSQENSGVDQPFEGFQQFTKTNKQVKLMTKFDMSELKRVQKEHKLGVTDDL